MTDRMATVEQWAMRYIVPFSFDADGTDYEQILRNLAEDEAWEPADIRQEDHDIYAYVYHAFEQVENDTSNVGCAWNYARTARGNRAISTVVYRPDDTHFVYVDIVQAGVYLFRSGIGLFWYEIRMNQKRPLLVDDMVQFQNYFRELNLKKNVGRFYRLVKKNVCSGIDADCLLEELPENAAAKDYVYCGFEKRKNGKYILRQHLPVFQDSEDMGIDYRLFEKIQPAGDSQQEAVPMLKYTRVQKFTMGMWVTEMLAGLKCRLQYYPGRSNCLKTSGNNRKDAPKSVPKNVPDKALLFNYFYIKNDTGGRQALIRAAYHLTNGYGYSHLMPETIEGKVYQSFKDAYWYVTNEGCGYYVGAGGTNSSFFKGNMGFRVMTDYFLLYIMLLYQSYTLLHYSEKIEYGLSADAEKYLNASEDYIESLQKIRTEIHTFLLKSVHTSVGHIQYQNDFYNYALTELRIKEDVKSLTAGLDAIEELQEAKEDENKAEKRQIEDDRLSIGLGVLSFLAVLSAFSDGLGFLDMVKERGGIVNVFRSGPEYIVVFIIILVAFIFAARALKPTLQRTLSNKKKGGKADKKNE